MTRTEFRKLYFFSYSLQRTVLHMTSKDDPRRNESVNTQLGSESASALCTKMSACSHYSSWKPLLIMEASLKIRYHHFKERISIMIAWSAVILGINSTSNAGSNFHEEKPSEISCITSAINP